MQSYSDNVISSSVAPTASSNSGYGSDKEGNSSGSTEEQIQEFCISSLTSTWMPFANPNYTLSDNYPGYNVPLNHIVCKNGVFHHEFVQNGETHWMAFDEETQQEMRHQLEIRGLVEPQIIVEQPLIVEQYQYQEVQEGGYQQGSVEESVEQQTEQPVVMEPKNPQEQQEEQRLQFPIEQVQMPQVPAEFEDQPFQNREVTWKTPKMTKSDQVTSVLLELHAQHQHTDTIFTTGDLVKLCGLDLKADYRRIHDVLPPFELFGMLVKVEKGQYKFRPKGDMVQLDEASMNDRVRNIVTYVNEFKRIGGRLEDYNAKTFGLSIRINNRRIYDVQTSLKNLGIMEYDVKNKVATLLI